jgi:hypothetical protein
VVADLDLWRRIFTMWRQDARPLVLVSSRRHSFRVTNYRVPSRRGVKSSAGFLWCGRYRHTVGITLCAGNTDVSGCVQEWEHRGGRSEPSHRVRSPRIDIRMSKRTSPKMSGKASEITDLDLLYARIGYRTYSTTLRPARANRSARPNPTRAEPPQSEVARQNQTRAQ